MSTRSCIAVPHEGSWHGRYVHSDGYPSHMVPEILGLVERDGLDAVIKVITEEHYGWSSLNREQPDIFGVTPPDSYPTGDYGTPEYYAYLLQPGGMYGDGRFVNVPGYGIAYTTQDDQSSPDMWVTLEETMGTEWAYVLEPESFTVIEMWYPPKAPRTIGKVFWDGRMDAKVKKAIAST